MEALSLRDKKQIVLTGVSRGLGNALAHEFISLGHSVAGCARDATSIQALADQYTSPHRFETVDLSSDDDVKRFAEAVLQSDGAPDLLVNNAGRINTNAPLWDVPVDEFNQVFDVNVKGVYSMIRHFVPSMIDQSRGVIVNLSSGWGRSASADVAPYCGSKWAIEGMTQSLALELPAGMAAIPLNPGVINTDMLQSCFGASADSYGDATSWARTAAPFILSLNEGHNGQSLSAP